MSRSTSLTMMLLVVLLVPALLFAQTECKKVEKQVTAGCSKEQLKLTDEQHVKLEKLKLQYKLDNVDLKAEAKKLHAELHMELLKEDANRKSIDKLSKALMAVKAKMHDNRIDLSLAIKKLFTADQWKMYIKTQCCAMGCGGDCSCSHGCKCGGGAGCSQGKGMGCSQGKGMGCCGSGMVHKGCEVKVIGKESCGQEMKKVIKTCPYSTTKEKEIEKENKE